MASTYSAGSGTLSISCCNLELYPPTDSHVLRPRFIFFSTLLFAGAADTAKAQFDGLTTSLFFVMVAFALAYFFSCRNTSRLMESRAVLAASCVMVLLGSIGMMPGMLDRVPSLFSGGLAGFGSTVLFIAWFGVFTRKTVTGSII